MLILQLNLIQKLVTLEIYENHNLVSNFHIWREDLEGLKFHIWWEDLKGLGVHLHARVNFINRNQVNNSILDF